MILTVSGLAFCLSFIFALGGVGSAIVLIPVLHWLGYPLSEARPTGLFVNTVSLAGATVSNIRAKTVDYGVAVPLLVSSMAMAPAGAFLSQYIPSGLSMGMFTAFLIFSGGMMLFPAKGGEPLLEEGRRLPAALTVVAGGFAGMVSGMLGVGSGGVIAPLLLMMGLNPKRVAPITALVVPFSSFTGFLTYWAMGDFNAAMAVPVGLAACAGGYLGARFMRMNLSPVAVRRLLSVLILALAARMAVQIL